MKPSLWWCLITAKILFIGCGFLITQAQAQQAFTPRSAVDGEYALSSTYAPGATYQGIKLLGTVKLAPLEPRGLPMEELSGLAFDQDENILYALSDRGRLYHLRPAFVDTRLKDVQLLAVYPLMDVHGKPLKGRLADSEGLLAQRERNGIKGDTQLVISFERRHRIVRYTPEGRFSGRLNLPPRLADKHRYQKPNRGIEAVADDSDYGLLAAPEKPFKDSSNNEVEIVALNKPGIFWQYPLAAEPNAALVGMEILPDGSLLALERAHGRYFIPFITSIRRVRRLPVDHRKPLEVTTLARLSTDQGWNLDNFEGLTRHLGQRFFIVSDDNAMIYQSTLLSYFEVLEFDTLQRNRAASSLKLH